MKTVSLDQGSRTLEPPVRAAVRVDGARTIAVAFGVGLAVSLVGLVICFSVDHPVTLTMDSGAIVFPLTLEAFRSWTAWRLPEWTDRIWAGFSLLAYPGTGALYLPHLPGFLMTTAPAHLRAFDVTASLHLGIMAGGTSFLLQRLGAGVVGALVGAALTVVAAAPLWGALAFLPGFLALAWWPWSLAAAEGLASDGPLPWSSLVLGVVALAAPTLGGCPEDGLCAGVVSAGWILFRRTHLGALPRVGRVLAITTGALALSAPQLLPAVLDPPTSHGATTVARGVAPWLPWSHIWTLFLARADVAVPPPIFVGVATAALAAVGIFTRRSGAIALVVAAASGAWLAGVTRTLVRADGVPALHLQGPPNVLVGSELAICWLAGLGVDHLARRRGAIAVVVGLAAIMERGAFLARWLPAMGATTAMTDVVAIVDTLAHAPFIDHAHESGAGRVFSSVRAWGDILPVVDIRSIGAGIAGFLGQGPFAFSLGSGPYRSAVVSLLGVRWVVAYPEDCDWMAQVLAFRVTSETDTLCVIENPHPDPIFTLGPGIEVETIEEATTRIQARPWAAPPVVTPPDATVPEDGPPDARGLVAVLRAEADGVTLGTSSPAARWLLVRETLSRGWTATIDGAPVTIHPAAGTFFAVRVPKGPHRVVISYRTPGLRAGLAIAVTWLALVGLAAVRARRRAPT